jgi:beta-glucanase (GH16 family)
MNELKKAVFLLFSIVLNSCLIAQINPYKPDNSMPQSISGMKLVWNDEFNIDGIPDTSVWTFEKGFVRNQELQWYQEENAFCKGGTLVIEGRREKVKNPAFVSAGNDWKRNREFSEYSSSSMQTRGRKQWQYGRFEIRARIDTSKGSWPAIWTLGVTGQWPSNGEIDIMEFYRINGTPTILANAAWGTAERWKAKWDDAKPPLSGFTKNDPEWVNKFHIWKMEWDEKMLSLFIDEVLINSVSLAETINPDGFNPMHQPHYLIINLALGANGGDPSETIFPIKFEVDYVRVYQKK